MTEDKQRTFRLYAKPKFFIVCPTPSPHNRDIKMTKKRTTTIEGSLSPNSRRKLRNAIRWLVAASDVKMIYEKKHKKKVPYLINEFTLTFPNNMQDDKLARSLLSKWLEVAKYRWDMHLYVWKAEPQERGAIHFHGITNTYIPHKEVNFTWNRLLMKHGIDAKNANSTDVHAVTNINNAEAYLTDYFLNDEKHEGRRKIKGKLWGCSHALSQAGKIYIVLYEDETKVIQNDNYHISLHNKFLDEGKEIPDFLKYTDIFLFSDKDYRALPECGLRELYLNEVRKLKALKSQKQFWSND